MALPKSQSQPEQLQPNAPRPVSLALGAELCVCVGAAQMAAKHFAKIKARWTTGRLDQFEEVKGPAYAKEPKINSSAQVSVTA